MQERALEARRLCKSYVGTRALRDVSLAFDAGRVHAVIGRNGAGKSTLVKILSGAVAPSSGDIVLDGAPLRLRSPRDALARGIATVHQELSLIDDLSVAENVMLGRYPCRKRLPFLVDHAASRERAARILASVGSTLDPRARVRSLSFAQQQVVEIARALRAEPRVLLLDEPTSGLSHEESEAFIRLARSLAARGVVVVHVTHRMDELARIADTVTALRDGREIATIPVTEATPERLVDLMFGSADLPRTRVSSRRAEGDAPPVLAARGLAAGPRVAGVDLAVRPGETLGIAGMPGSGRSEILLALFGAVRGTAGDVLVDGARVDRPTPRRMIALGIALVPEDRKRQGLALPMSVLDNVALAGLPLMTRFGLLFERVQRRAVEPILTALRVVAAGLDQPVATLSGGNQQKVVAGKWLVRSPRVLLLDEPTRGIDLESRRQLFDAVANLTAHGVAAIIVSSEFEELMETCDRIVVLRRGRIVAETRPADTTLPRLVALAMGA